MHCIYFKNLFLILMNKANYSQLVVHHCSIFLETVELVWYPYPNSDIKFILLYDITPVTKNSNGRVVSLASLRWKGVRWSDLHLYLDMKVEGSSWSGTAWNAYKCFPRCNIATKKKMLQNFTFWIIRIDDKRFNCSKYRPL